MSRLKIGFIYNAPCNILELTQDPTDLAGAAICYLAIQLVKLGHDVTLFSHSENNVYSNVRCRHFEIKDQSLVLDPALLEKDFSILIFKDTSPEFALSIKGVLPYKPEIYLWTEHDHMSSLNNGLWSPDIVDQLTGIFCVSSWQRGQIMDSMRISHNKIFVLQYAISPLFENLFLGDQEFLSTKSKAPQMAYIATQDNGLEILLESYFNISDNYANASLSIFSNVTAPDLQNIINASRGITVYEELPKKQLATLLRTYTIFTNPNTIPASSNVILLEAMAAGLYPVISDVGANTDYCQGQGKVVPAVFLNSNSLDSYISEVLKICQGQLNYTADFNNYCYKQTIEINKKHTWAVRAKELIDLLELAKLQNNE